MKVAYDKLIPALKHRLPKRSLDLLGRSVDFIRRLRSVRASTFVWAVVLSRFGHGLPGFEEARRWYEELGGEAIWRRPFQMRFKTPAAVALLERSFDRAVAGWRGSQGRMPAHPLARKLADVVAVDSTLVQVADDLADVFPGTRATPASLKVLLSMSVFGSLPLAAKLYAGHRHDQILFPALDLFRKGTLLLFDKGFVAYERLRSIAAADLFYLCPMRLNGRAIIEGINQGPKKVRTALKQTPKHLSLRDVLPRDKRIRKAWDLNVVIRGGNKRVYRTRLVIVPGPKGVQRPYLTNLPAAEWEPSALKELYRLRWQIELVFRELKQDLNLTSVPTKDPHAAQCLVWASLLALAVSRTVSSWLCPPVNLVGLAAPIRPSLVSRALRGCAYLLGRALRTKGARLAVILEVLAHRLAYEVHILERKREDSFVRLKGLLEAA